MRRPLFLPPLTLRLIDEGGGRACFARRGFPALRVERLVNSLKRSVPTPKIEVIVERRARRQVLRDGAPLAAGAEDVHEAVDDLAHLDMTSIAAALSRRNQRLDMRPFGVGQIARVAEPAASAASAVFVAPHYRRRSELMRSIHDVIRVSPLRRERGRGPWPPDGLESILSPPSRLVL